MTEPGRLDGVALVTGGTGALGRATVAELLEAGAEVVVSWIAAAEREAMEAAFEGREGLTLVEADLLAGGAETAVATAAQRGPLRSLVNLAGGFAAGERLHEGSPGDLERMLALNLTTAVNACRAAIPEMLEAGGAIVCVGAKTAHRPFSGGAAYAISKAAVLALVRSLDVEYRGDGIRANAILPSVIDTPANREASPDADHSKWVQPAEIARVVRFLAGPDSAPVSGAEVPVYGSA